MENDLTKKESDYSFTKYFECNSISEDTQEKLTSNEMLILPNCYSDNEFYFAQETINFVKFCRNTINEVNVDILADEDKVEIRELRSYDIWMPIIYISKNYLLPIVISLVANYLYDRLRGRENEKTMVNLSLIIKTEDSMKQLNYVGDAKTFEKTFKEIDINKM